MTYVLFVIWFFFLIEWADLLVKWASTMAIKFKIPPIVIWLTIVAFWTSAPELIVNIISAIRGNTDLAVWNIIWSNIANILLILWAWSIIYPIVTKKETTHKEIPFSLLAVVILLIMWSDVLLDWISANMISRGDWLVLLWFFIIFLVYSFSITKTWDVKNQVEWEIQKISVSTSIFFMVLWITWLTLWWQWIVNWAINIAESFGIKESVIWLTIVAIGTSLPELATSIVAAYKKESDIAIWNVVWSNIFNVFLILWLTAIISPIPISDGVSIDISVAIVASLILLAIMYIGKKYTIEKWQGGIMVALYVSYLVFLVVSS